MRSFVTKVNTAFVLLVLAIIYFPIVGLGRIFLEVVRIGKQERKDSSWQEPRPLGDFHSAY